MCVCVCVCAGVCVCVCAHARSFDEGQRGTGHICICATVGKKNSAVFFPVSSGKTTTRLRRSWSEDQMT